jgi:hypothetical protein
MERICIFYKESDGSWFIKLPEWQGSKADLQMVLGADTLLDIMAQGHQEILVRFSTEGFPGANVMSWFLNGIPGDPDMGGAMYRVEEYNTIAYNFDIWLCDVTKFVFGEFPKHIYYNCLTEV